MRQLLLLVTLVSLLLATACFNSDQSNDGVARINEVSSEVETNDEVELTNEERATQFVECMRNFGFKDLTDPTIKADGSIEWGAIKQSLGGVDQKDVKLRNAYDKCLPLLESVTQTKSSSAEDEEEMRDKLLKFAGCLREKGLDVQDPDFSVGGNEKAFLSGLNRNSSKVNRIQDECSQIVYGRALSGGKDK